jgi:hypothetical protein
MDLRQARRGIPARQRQEIRDETNLQLCPHSGGHGRGAGAPRRRRAEPSTPAWPPRSRPADAAGVCGSCNPARTLVDLVELMTGALATSSPPDTPRRTHRAAPRITRSLWPSFAPLGAIAVAISGRVEGQRLYEVTIPGLAIDSEFTDVRRSLLAAFPRVVEVFAMRTPETLLIAYRGEDEADAWCETLSRAVVQRRRARVGPEKASPTRPKALTRPRPAGAVAAHRSP